MGPHGRLAFDLLAGTSILQIFGRGPEIACELLELHAGDEEAYAMDTMPMSVWLDFRITSPSLLGWCWPAAWRSRKSRRVG